MTKLLRCPVCDNARIAADEAIPAEIHCGACLIERLEIVTLAEEEEVEQ